MAPRAAIAGIGLALGAAQALAVDLDDPDATPLHFALETLSAEAVTVTGSGAARGTYYNVEAPADDAALTAVAGLRFSGDGTYVRVDLDGMVFSATPELTTGGEGAGSGFASTDSDVVLGGSGEAFVVYRLPSGQTFAQGLTFAVSVRDSLAVPALEGAYRASMQLYDELNDALDRENALSYRAFGGEATAVVVTSGIEVGIESAFAIADAGEDFLEFVAESASGASADPDNPSAPAALGSIAVDAVTADPGRGRAPVYAARGGAPVTVADVVRSVGVRVDGDMTFGTLDFRTGTASDRCQHTSPPAGDFPGGGVVPLLPPPEEETVGGAGLAMLDGDDEPWGTRHLCVWLPEREAGAMPVRIPIVFYEATVSVEPPFGETVVRSGNVGVIGRSGTQVRIAHLGGSERYEQLLVMVNSGFAPVRYVFDTFQPAAGVAVALSPEAVAADEAGLNVIEPGTSVVLPVGETLAMTGGGEAPFTAATLWFNGDGRHIHVAVVQTNLADGSTDTVAYPALPAVRPEDAL